MNVMIMHRFVYFFRNSTALWAGAFQKTGLCVPVKWQLGYGLIGTSVEPWN